MDRGERDGGVLFERQELLAVERDARDVDFAEFVFCCHDFHGLSRGGERLFREQLKQNLSVGFFMGGAVALDLRLLTLDLRCLAQLVFFGEEQRLLVTPRFEIEERQGEGTGQNLFSCSLALVLHADGEARSLLSAGELGASSRERLFGAETSLRPAFFFRALSLFQRRRRRQPSIGFDLSRLQTERKRQVRTGRKMGSFGLEQESSTASRLRSSHRKFEGIGLTKTYPCLREAKEFLGLPEGSLAELEEIVRESEVEPSVPRGHGCSDPLEPERLFLQTQLTFRYLSLETTLSRKGKGLRDANDDLGSDPITHETRAELRGEVRRQEQRGRSCLFGAKKRGAGRESDQDIGTSLHGFLERLTQTEDLDARMSLGMSRVVRLDVLGGAGVGR